MSIFNQTARPRVGSSTFNLSHDRKFSLDQGFLTPMLCQEVVPGDEWNVTTQQMLRFMPMLSPVMHEFNVFTHFFFVPNRIMWDGWEDFITGGENGLDTTLFPTVSAVPSQVSSLADYLGLPINLPVGEKVSLLPFKAYNMIYHEYYRDQNAIPEEEYELVDGNVDANIIITAGFPNFFKLRKRAWQHDYFTSALPFAQKGVPVKIPLVNTAGQYLDVEYDRLGGTTKIVRQSDGGPSNDGSGLTAPNATTNIVTDSNGTVMSVNNAEQLRVPLNSLDTNAANINDLRKAFKVQEWLELAARGGSRLKETIKSFFGVNTSDGRLQRPEYLGGGMSPVMVSETLQTSETENSPQGNMAGHGLNLGKSHSFKRFFEEHGYIIGIVSVMPKTAYQQGIPKTFLKFDKFDYFWPQFEHIGEQPIINKELWLNGTADDKEIFGYIPRYSEYKYIPPSVHGQFRTTLNFWHAGRIFDTRPFLNKDFIECNPTKRYFAVEDPEENALLCQMWHNITCRRKMSYFSDPQFRI